MDRGVGSLQATVQLTVQDVAAACRLPEEGVISVVGYRSKKKGSLGEGKLYVCWSERWRSRNLERV